MTTMTINTNVTGSTSTNDNKIDLQLAIVKQLKSLVRKISLAYTIYNERRALRNISDEMLQDMGITRTELNAECNRSAFDVPANRK